MSEGAAVRDRQPETRQHDQSTEGCALRIVHVITRLLNAGAEENTFASCLHQVRAGHQVWLVHGDEFNPAWYNTLPPGLNLVRMDEMVHAIRPWRDLSAFRRLRRLYAELRPNVIHTHQSKAGILGRLAAFGSGIPAVVHTVHIAPFLNVGAAQRKFYVSAEKLCAWGTDGIINVSAGMRDACLDHGVGRPDRHSVIESGMDIERFRDAKPPLDWRGRIGGWSSEQKPFFVLMLAAFEPRKRQEPFLTAMAPFLRADPDLCVLFAGAGARLEATRALAARLGVDNQTRFMGHDPNADELIALSDLCVMTSAREGLPRVVVQYLACGRPVVLNDLPGIERLIRDGENGRIAAADDMDAVARLIANLVADRVALANLRGGAESTDVTPWAEERMGVAIEAVYRDILQRKSLPRGGRP